MKTHSRGHRIAAALFGIGSILIFGGLALMSSFPSALVPASVAVASAILVVGYFYRQHAAVAALVAALVLSPLLISHSEAHAASVPAPAAPVIQTLPEGSCYTSAVGWAVYTGGLLAWGATGYGIIVGAWGEIMAIDGIVTYCNSSYSGLPFYWTLIYFSPSGGGGSW